MVMIGALFQSMLQVNAKEAYFVCAIALVLLYHVISSMMDTFEHLLRYNSLSSLNHTNVNYIFFLFYVQFQNKL